MEQSKPKISIFSFIYKQSYLRILHCLRDVRVTNKICNSLDSNYASELFFSKGSETWEIGAEFSFLWKRLIKMFFRTVEYTETPDFSRIRWKVYKTEPQTFEYYLTYNLYKDITGNFNTFVMEWEYYVEIYQTENDQETIKSENILIFSAIDKYLSQEENKRLQEECTYIQSDLNILWKIISNFCIFQRLVPTICKKVVYSGEITSGTKVTLFFDSKNTTYCMMCIKSITVRENLCRIVYECCSDCNPPVPKQEIEWTIEEKEGGFCLVSFRHYYQEVLKQDSILQTSKLKKKILQSLKIMVERDLEENMGVASFSIA